ncbi:Rieske (2Fe-2S) protein [Kribbella sp. NBC_00359]|uniref:Rieske (2Fe-2S) protein n=1 Tax=Kribbella sp. NBC_00359 TaxID=2975966 RepID=UPI003FA56468
MTTNWHRVDEVDVPADGRVRSVVVDGRSIALARCEARLGALENRCPHQGGPLGEGSIETGLLRPGRVGGRRVRRPVHAPAGGRRGDR